MNERLPPHSIEAEQGALGCAILEPATCLDPLSAIPPEAFYVNQNRAVFLCLRSMHREGKTVDAALLCSRLRDEGQLEPAGGDEHILRLAGNVVSTANFQAYLDELKEKHVAREGIQAAVEFAQRIYNQPHLIDRHLELGAESFNAARAYLPNRNGKLTIRRPSEILSLPRDPSRNMLADHLLIAGQALVILGEGGIGKSRLLLQLAAASILRQPWIGLETHFPNPCKWLILQAENSNDRLQDDLNALKAWTNSHFNAFDTAVQIHTLETDADNFLNLNDPAAVRLISEAIDSWQPHIVAWDSLYNFGVGDLNKDQDMKASCLAIARLSKRSNPNRAIIVLHHATTGRAGALKATGYDRSSFARNSKVIYNWCRGQINLAPGGDGEDENCPLVVSCGKCSNGQRFPTFAIRLNQESMLYEVDGAFDLKSWQANLAGSKSPLMDVEKVKELCSSPISRADLSKLIISECGCRRETSYKYIWKAERQKIIKFSKATELFTTC